MTNAQANRRALLLLAAGGVVGIFLGVATAFRQSDPAAGALPADAIALVNGRPIREEEYTRAVAMLAADKRTEITNEDRAHVLTRLIEEELLVQRGIEIGLIDSDRAVRKAVTQAMLASIIAESASEQPSEDDLRTFYEKNVATFVHAPAVANGEGVSAEKTMKPPLFEEIRGEVEVAYLRQVRDDALRAYLQWLRDEAKIALASEARP
jgi:hypothetical protein